MRTLIVFILLAVHIAVQGSRFDSILSRAPADKNKIWVVLVAGSSGWMNYRHQSDVCHLYKLLTKHHNIPRRQVITMMYNDIAFNEENPFPGTIINALHGTDVYEGTMIDYMGDDVTPENFLKILRGEVMRVGSRKTLDSGPGDHVFVNFVDHGDTGVLGFPRDELHLVDLNSTLYQMHENKKYSQMLWYVEACFSGSMFESLSPDLNITALTAANSEESSWACVWDDDISSFLGDCWSLNWMNNTEQIYPSLNKETVEQQYEIVKAMTTESHASRFGDLSNTYHDKLSQFFGHPKMVEHEPMPRILDPPRDAAPTPDVLLETLRRRRDRFRENLNSEQYDAYHEVNEQIRYHEEKEGEARNTIQKIVSVVAGSELASSQQRQPIRDPQCNKDVLSTFYRDCYRLQEHPYITKYTFLLSNLCNLHNNRDLVTAIRRVCASARA